MSNQVEVVVSGDRAQAAAAAIVLSLIARGATVTGSGNDVFETGSADGLEATVRVRDATSKLAAPRLSATASSARRLQRLLIGGVCLLAFVGFEVKMHFGPRLDVILTFAAVWYYRRWLLDAADGTT